MGIWLELNKRDFRKPQGLKWNSNTIKVLGKTYGNNINQTREQNWEKTRKKCERI